MERIILYNPISGHGHMDGWLAMFTSILLRLGYTVFCLTPDTEALLLRLHQRNIEKHPNVTVMPWPTLDDTLAQEPDQQLKERILGRLRELKSTYVNRLKNSRVTSDMPFYRRCKKRLAQLIVPPAYAIFKTVCRIALFSTPLSSVSQSEADSEAGYLSPKEWGQRIKIATRTLPLGRYFLFNMFLDMYRTDQSSWKEFARYCPLPWAAFRVNPGLEPREAYYSLPAMRGMCLLDEAKCQTYLKAVPKKHFACLPDVVADVSLPVSQSPVGQSIINRAAGRKVVFMGGSIGVQKNITQWRELIRRADTRRFFFAQIGEIHYSTCPSEEQNTLRELASAPPENFLMIEEYLADERDFNSCIAASDVIFAVYKNFRNSSNMPGKAAAFGKPILVSDRYLMGETVRHYGLGAAVPEDDAKAILTALERLIQMPPPKENFTAYNATHNEEVMGHTLERFFNGCKIKKEI